MADDLLPQAWAALFVFARIGTILMVLPVFGEGYVSPRIRLTFALLLTALLMPVLGERVPAPPLSPLTLAALILPEILIGLIFGYLIKLAYMALQVAGTVIALQNGLAFAQSLDPSQGMQSALTASFLSLLATLLVFASGLHHVMLSALAASYGLFPPAAGLDMGAIAEGGVDTIARFFLLGISLSAPFLVFGLVFNVGLGILSKLMPQVQIFFVGVPASILLGFAMLMVLVGAMMTTFLEAFGAHLGRLMG